MYCLAEISKFFPEWQHMWLPNLYILFTGLMGPSQIYKLLIPCAQIPSQMLAIEPDGLSLYP